METTIKINTDQLTLGLLESIKKMFPHEAVDITIQPADETEYILSNPVYARELEDRISEYDKKKETISLKADELL